MTDDLTYEHWKAKAETAQARAEAFRRDNERLAMKVAELSAIIIEMRRDLYWHVERLQRAIHP